MKARFRIGLDIDVDGEMRVHISHFVLKAPRNANDEVVYEGFDSPESRHVLACTMMQLDVDDIFGGIGKTHGKMGQIFGQFPWKQGVISRQSMSVCLMEMNIPLGPSTVTILDLIWILTMQL